MMEHLWNSYYVRMRITYRKDPRDRSPRSNISTFDCDSHIAEAIRLLNEKGYATGNCCEGHPYSIIPDTNMDFESGNSRQTAKAAFCKCSWT